LLLKNYTHERYELMGKYDQESLFQIDPQFKRILFWNEVYKRIIRIGSSNPSKVQNWQDYDSKRLIFRLTEAKITMSESVAMPCGNGGVPYGSAKRRTAATMSRITTPLFFTSAVGAG
jgi:hypothetical protein